METIRKLFPVVHVGNDLVSYDGHKWAMGPKGYLLSVWREAYKAEGHTPEEPRLVDVGNGIALLLNSFYARVLRRIVYRLEKNGKKYGVKFIHAKRGYKGVEDFLPLEWIEIVDA